MLNKKNNNDFIECDTYKLFQKKIEDCLDLSEVLDSYEQIFLFSIKYKKYIIIQTSINIIQNSFNDL